MTYKQRKSKDEALEQRMKELSTKHRRFGLPRLHFLLKREGLVVSHHRSERVYRKLRLQLKNRRRVKQMAVIRVPHKKATTPNEIWSFDFVFDRFENNRSLKCLTIVDDCTKRTPGLLVETSITAKIMIHFFESLSKLPKKLRCDNGPEMSSKEFMDWAYRNNIAIEYSSSSGQRLFNVNHGIEDSESTYYCGLGKHSSRHIGEVSIANYRGEMLDLIMLIS